jgi:iron complex transport system substrate-binding protein
MSHRRIASLVSSGTEILYALGLAPNVVAVSHECDWPPECRELPRVTKSNVDTAGASAAIDQQVRELMASGAPLYEIDSTALAELQPDLIVTQAQCDVCAVRYADVLATVEREPRLCDSRVLGLNPQSLAEVLDDILRVGEAAGIRDKAEAVVRQLKMRIDDVWTRAESIPALKCPRVAMIEWTDPLMLAGNWVPELVELAGGRCELTLRGQHSRYHTWDELLRFDPEVIVVCPCGFDLRRAEEEVELLSLGQGWAELAAVGAGRVYPLDGNAYFNRPGPRLVESLEWLAAKLLSIWASAGEGSVRVKA